METRSNHILVGGVTLLMLVGLISFIVWLARAGGDEYEEYDIFFSQAVSGLNRGSQVSFAGVPSGEVTQIALWKPDPDFVRVRIRVNKDVPILQGVTATIQGVGFTGVSQIQLDGAAKGAPPITCPAENPKASCPGGVPVIPTKPGALGELLNTAPQLVERLATLTERLTEVLSDENQQSVAGILNNVEGLTKELERQGPELQNTMRETQVAIKQVGTAADKIGVWADSADGWVNQDAKALIADLRKTVQTAERSLTKVETTIGEAQPGLRSFSEKTIPEVGALVRDLRDMSQSLANVADKIDQGGASSLIGSPKLPDYKPQKKAKQE
jgi:phospholipid/cholesterol/gamma-HCH transport system substrate-binding protein